MSATHKTYEIRAYTTPAGYARLDEILRKCARLYNAALEEWKAAYRHKGHSLSVSRTKYDQMKELTGVRKDNPEFWGSLSLQVARGVLVRLDRARQSFYRRVKAVETPGFPRFKSSRRWRTIELAETTKSMLKKCGSGYQLKIKGMPTLRLLKSQKLPPPEDLKSATITRRGRRLQVNLTYAIDMEPLPENDEAIGIDMGVTERLTLSTGEVVKRRRKPNNRLKRSQQRLSSCRKGSRQWRKRQAILANQQERERIRNRNECHRITTDLVRRFGLIALEDLRIGNMTRSAAGTIEKPGKNIRQKSGLNRSVAEQTWGIITRQLSYKAEWAGRELTLVNPRHTSQICSACEVIDPASRNGKQFLCRACGMTQDADQNAAINILKRAGGNLPAAALDAA